MIVSSGEERAHAVEAGKRLGLVLEALVERVQSGISTQELEDLANELIEQGGDVTAFKDYTPEGATRPYPATLCVSINDEVVHGIPNEVPRTLRAGDIVSLDLGLIHAGIVVDSAVTVPVGEVDAESLALMGATRAALEDAIAAAEPGQRVGDISHAIEHSFKGTGFSVVKVLGGHGVGTSVHEEPWIPNAGHPGTGEELVPGMLLALEPIANLGKSAVVLAPDGYTYRTRDGSRSAHFEHTILIEENGTNVLTRRTAEHA